jgi:hypothetical protein
MATSSTSAITYNPKILEPFPIESTLAQGVEGDNPMAVALLNQYQADRGLAQEQYGHEVESQRQYLMQQLMQQASEKQVEGINTAADKGTLRLFHGTGLLPALDRSDPAALNFREQQYDTGQDATNFMNYGKGAQDLTTAGLQPNAPDIEARTGLKNINQLPAVPVQVEQIKSATELAKAAAAAKVAAMPSRSYTGQELPGGGRITTNYGAKLGATNQYILEDQVRNNTPGAREQLLDYYKNAYGTDAQGNVNLPPNSPLRTQTSPAPTRSGAATPPGRGTSLPPAKTDTPANNAPPAATSSTAPMRIRPVDYNDANVRNKVDAMRQALNSGNPAAVGLTPQQFKAAQEGMVANQGRPNFGIDQNGQYHLLDGKGAVVR